LAASIVFVIGMGMECAMKVVVLVSEVPELSGDQTVEAKSGLDAFITADAVEEGLLARNYIVERAVIRKGMLDALEPYPPREWLIFNLCETLEGETYREAYVPAVLDAMGYTYTGSSTRTLHRALNKARTKQLLVQHGLPTARYQVFASAEERIDVPFPAFVKPVAQDASIGVSDRAVVHNADELRAQVNYILKEMGEPALAEEFIKGREFNVAIWGNNPPQILPLAEIDFSQIQDPYQQIISYAAKWDEATFEYHHTYPDCPAMVAEPLAERIRRVALQAYQLLECRDYGRVDLRVRDDEPYILEVNPNCGIAPDAGFVREARVAGFSYAEMVEQLVVFAQERAVSKSQK
jgi:D-alanine-D-alanine ligase